MKIRENPWLVLLNLRQSEVYGHKRLRLHRAAVDQIRLVTPLLHRAICRLPEKKRSANQLEVLDGAIPRDPGLSTTAPCSLAFTACSG